MAYDEALAERVREHLPAAETKPMFGTLVFMVDGKMHCAVAAGGLMVRTGDEALARPHTRRSEMGGKPMKGWVLVEPEGLEDLGAWI